MSLVQMLTNISSSVMTSDGSSVSTQSFHSQSASTVDAAATGQSAAESHEVHSTLLETAAAPPTADSELRQRRTTKTSRSAVCHAFHCFDPARHTSPEEAAILSPL